MQTEFAQPNVEEIFQRSLSAHLPPESFRKLQTTSVLLAGVGGGGNIAELMARKGFGNLTISDLDIFEPHNVRQRLCLMSTLGKEKTQVTYERLMDINPSLTLRVVPEGITLANVGRLVQQADYIVDMLDLHAIKEKVALHRLSRRAGKFVLTAPSVLNGAVLWIFPPDGPSFEEFAAYSEDLPLGDVAWNLLRRAIPNFPPDVAESCYRGAAYGKRSLPLDAVGVDLASVLTVGALENLVLGKLDRVVLLPKGLQVDLSNPNRWVQLVDYRSNP